jgi:hypothetical protein
VVLQQKSNHKNENKQARILVLVFYHQNARGVHKVSS